MSTTLVIPFSKSKVIMPPQETKGFETAYGVTVPTRQLRQEKIEVGTCNVFEIGLEKFIRRIVKELDLHLEKEVSFNLNERAMLFEWNRVFEVEKVYSTCLGISERHYKCHSYIHKPNSGLTYFILEETNKRTWSFLPEFNFHVIVFCYYDKKRKNVTKVEVQYDQLSFFLCCLGLAQFNRWMIANIVTPLACIWMRMYKLTGAVHPVTFLLQVMMVTIAIYWYSKSEESSTIA